MSQETGPIIDWSHATDAVLAFCGIGTDRLDATDPGMFVTPDLPGEDLTVKIVELRSKDNAMVGKLSPPCYTTRAIPAAGDAPSPEQPRGSHPLLGELGLRIRRLRDVPSDWRAILFASIEGDRIPVGWRTDHGIRISTAVRDGLASELAFAPLLDGFYERKNLIDPCPTADWITRAFADSSPTTVDVLPPVVTLRLDYDRPIATSELRSLLALLKETDVRASCGFLLRREEDVVPARMIRDAGHEILLHTVAPDRDTFLDEVDRFESRFGVYPRGYTAHGGRGAAGYLGQRQWQWAIEAEMLYGEMLGRLTRRMQPLVLVDEEGVARTAPLVAPGVHFSLDLGMKPEAHDLDRLLMETAAAMRPGGHVVIMNHPDLHRSELRAILESMASRRPQSSTFEELATGLRTGRSEKN